MRHVRFGSVAAAALFVAIAAPVSAATVDGNGGAPGQTRHFGRVVDADPRVDAPATVVAVPSGATKIDLATLGATTWTSGGRLGF